MHFKQKGNCLIPLLLLTITTLSLPSVGRCEPTVYSPLSGSRLALPDDRNRLLTSRGGLACSSKRGGKQRRPLDSTQGGGSASLLYFDYLEDRDGTQTPVSSGRLRRTTKSSLASTTTVEKSFKNREKPRQNEGGWMYISPSPASEACSKGEIKAVTQGRFYIAGQVEANVANVGYQADSAATGQKRIRGQRLGSTEDIWQRLQPVVVCGDYAMNLTVRRRRAVQLLLDRVNESSMPLSQLPPKCGYSVQTTWRDLRLMAQYDACHVAQEDDSYVLPLLWRGTSVKMSCPASQSQSEAVDPPSVCCSPYSMTVKVQGLSATELSINVRGEWAPMEVLVEQCGYTLHRQDADIIITAPFITCGITVEGGKYTLSLQMGEKIFTLACPVSPTEEPPLTRQPLVNSPHNPTGGPVEGIAESLEPFQWAPPFYLAPPYYPHPTYRYEYLSPDRNHAYNPSTLQPSTPDPFGPQPLHPVDSQPDYRDYFFKQIPLRESFGVHSSQPSTGDMEDPSQFYPDRQQKQETSVLGLSEKNSAAHSHFTDGGFLNPVDAPPLQPPTHAFSQYYHYYHHPKIPLSDPPQDPDPAPVVSSLHNHHNPESPGLPSSIHQAQVLSRLNLDQFLQLDSEPASHPDAVPTNAPYIPYPPQHYPYQHFSYFPLIAKGEANKWNLFNSDTPAKTDLSYENTKSNAFAASLPLSDLYNDYSQHPHINHPMPDKMTPLIRGPDWIKRPPLSDYDVKVELKPPGRDGVTVSPPEHPSFPTISPFPDHPPFPYYYPPHQYYQMYYGTESLRGPSNHVSPTSSKESAESQHHASSSPPQNPSHLEPQNPTPPTQPMYNVHHPHYYYSFYYQPKLSLEDQKELPAGSRNSKSESQLPDYSWMDWLGRAAVALYPNMPQASPFQSLHPNDVAEQHLYDPIGQPDGEAAGKRLDNKEGCTVGQHLIFAVPDSVVKATVNPLTHPTEVSNMSCALQKLTSDLEVYIVPLDGCGINKHSGEGVGHLLEVHGVHSLQQDHMSVFENSPVKLMVECNFSPGSSGEVMDQPLAQSTRAMVTVQLRISTDESFTSFHPEAHLPLSLIRGRPVYVQVSLLDPPEPGLVLLVHSCLAYTQATYASWMCIYDGCPSRSASQLLPSPNSDHIRRIIVSSFLSLPSEGPTYLGERGYSHLEDPEVFFLCLTEVCSTADGDCTVGCINSPNSQAYSIK